MKILGQNAVELLDFEQNSLKAQKLSFLKSYKNVISIHLNKKKLNVPKIKL